MTDYRTQINATVILLPGGGEFPLRDHLRHQQQQLDYLTQAITEMKANMQLQTMPDPPPQDLQSVAQSQPQAHTTCHCPSDTLKSQQAVGTFCSQVSSTSWSSLK